MKYIGSFFFITTIVHAEIFYIVPPHGFANEVLFTCVENNNYLNHDDCVLHFYELRNVLRQYGHDLKTIASPEIPYKSIVITSGFPEENFLKQLRKRARKIITFIWEPTTVEPQSYTTSQARLIDKIFTMCDDHVDNKKYFKHYFTQPHLFIKQQKISFDKKRLLTLISSNKQAHYNKEGELYTERIKAILFFNDMNADFSFYGNGWPPLKTYGGIIKEKTDVLMNFKFCICFENTRNMNGYITEKIFDCFHAGCIPIYLGAPNITTYIPSSCFIDMKKFKNYTDLYAFISTISNEQYQRYIHAIQCFLQSDMAHRFSSKNFIEKVLYELLH